MKGRKTALYNVVLVITALFASNGINTEHVVASAEMVPENTVILSNETVETFCRDFLFF